MAFRLPANLAIGQQYQAVSPGDVATLEAYLPSSSRMLVGLVFAERYDGFEEDCQLAELELQKQAGLSTWPEYTQFVTPDPDGQPIAWVSYQSSPVWWTFILITLGGIFLLPILSVLPMWIIDKMFPGAMDMITMVVMLMVVGGVMVFLPKMLAPAKEERSLSSSSKQGGSKMTSETAEMIKDSMDDAIRFKDKLVKRAGRARELGDYEQAKLFEDIASQQSDIVNKLRGLR